MLVGAGRHELLGAHFAVDFALTLTFRRLFSLEFYLNESVRMW